LVRGVTVATGGVGGPRPIVIAQVNQRDAPVDEVSNEPVPLDQSRDAVKPPVLAAPSEISPSQPPLTSLEGAWKACRDAEDALRELGFDVNDPKFPNSEQFPKLGLIGTPIGPVFDALRKNRLSFHKAMTALESTRSFLLSVDMNPESPLSEAKKRALKIYMLGAKIEIGRE
jgi:hypothetical protein